jgi:hypothetical protein
MSRWLRFIFAIIILILLTTLHVGFVYFLPYPFSKINLLFSVFIILLLWWDSGMVVWLVFFSHFLLELFSASPFGVVLFSSVTAFLVSFWLYRTVFTNRSWYAALALSFFTLTFFRLLYIAILSVLYLFKIIYFIPWNLFLITWFWETIFTLILVLIVYFIISRFSHRLNAAIIESSIYGRG